MPYSIVRVVSAWELPDFVGVVFDFCAYWREFYLRSALLIEEYCFDVFGDVRAV